MKRIELGFDEAPTTKGLSPMENMADFPGKSALRSDESGQGYALRMAEFNGLQGLWPIKRLLGKSHSCMLDERDASRLSAWFGAEPSALAEALGTPINGRGEGGEHRYAGLRFTRRHFVDRWRSRVCLGCLEESGYCRVDWDFALVTACPVHGCSLATACHHCGSRLTWNRPAMGVCGACRHPLDTGRLDRTPTELEIQVAEWVRSKLVERHGMTVPPAAEPCSRALTQPAALVRMIDPIGLNGGWSVIHALAALAAYICCPLPLDRAAEAPKKVRTLLTANAVAEHMAGHLLQLRVSRPASIVRLLADMAAGDATACERQLAWSLLGLVMREPTKVRSTGAQPQLSQTSLF